MLDISKVEPTISRGTQRSTLGKASSNLVARTRVQSHPVLEILQKANMCRLMHAGNPSRFDRQLHALDGIDNTSADQCAFSSTDRAAALGLRETVLGQARKRSTAACCEQN